jgi:hypothetical protein
MITPATFVYRYNFPTLDDTVIQVACDYVENVWAGVPTLWQKSPSATRDSKIAACQNLLVAWYLTDMMPSLADGIAGNGGMAIMSKKIGGEKGISIEMRNMNEQDSMAVLSTNAFGQKALQMISFSPERMKIWG